MSTRFDPISTPPLSATKKRVGSAYVNAGQERSRPVNHPLLIPPPPASRSPAGRGKLRRFRLVDLVVQRGAGATVKVQVHYREMHTPALK